MEERVSDCCEEISLDTWRCKTTGITIHVTQYPFRCGCQSRPKPEPIKVRTDLEPGLPKTEATDQPRPCCGAQMPNMLTQAKNLLGSVVGFVGSGMEVVSKAEYDARVVICNSCDRLVNGRCSECGCFIRLKAYGAIMRCPLNKWETDAVR